MIYDAFRREKRDVYWIVGSGFRVRHAMTTKPGAVCCGQWVQSLCETWLKIPSATPYSRVPEARHIVDCCPDCSETVQTGGYVSNSWDF